MVAMLEDSGLMPFVRFERVAVEDPIATREAGHFVAKDLDMAFITPPFSKDVIQLKVKNWLDQLRVDSNNGRVPSDWISKYQAAYDAWKDGQELPVDGFPIKGWGVCSPAQQETLIRMHVLTVEQLAQINEEGLRRIGMGAIDLKRKAEEWLKQINKAGKPTIEIAALKKENEALKLSIASLEEKVRMLADMVQEEPAGVSIDDLMAEE